jgi:hypothetical protein
MPVRFQVGDRVAQITRPLVGGSISAVRQYPMPLLDLTAREPFGVYDVNWEDGFSSVVTDDVLMPAYATPAMTQFTLAQEAALARLQPAIVDARALGPVAERALEHVIDVARTALVHAQVHEPKSEAPLGLIPTHLPEPVTGPR